MEILGKSGLKIFGQDFVDAETVGRLLVASDTVTLPTLTPEELFLEQARKRGEFLIHREGQTPDGKPLTMHWMVESLQALFDEKGRGQILYGPSLKWCQDQAFYMEATPRPGLAFVSKEPISGSMDQNYWQQTELLARLVGNVYEGREVPGSYQDALKEWGEAKDRLDRILISDWKEAAKGLAGLQINQLFREKPVEALFDTLMLFMHTKERRLQEVATWTNAITSGGDLVYFGRFALLGLVSAGGRPGFDSPRVGVCSSRSIL